jgi:hypothetical protein
MAKRKKPVYRCPACKSTEYLKIHVCGWRKVDGMTGEPLDEEVLDVSSDGDNPEMYCDNCDWAGMSSEAEVERQERRKNEEDED